jgi:hypothetical protein
VSSAAAPKNLVELANMFARFFNSGAMILVLAAIVIYFGGVARGLFKLSQGGGKGADVRKILLGGIIVIFLMVSIWGIIGILQETLFRTNSQTTNTGGATTPGTNLQFTNTPVFQ